MTNPQASVHNDQARKHAEMLALWDAYHADPIFPEQRCGGCGAEHPGLNCPMQDDLFGGAK